VAPSISGFSFARCFSRAILLTISCLLAAGLSARTVQAQGCVAVKMNVPILGDQDLFAGDQRWQVSVGYRWFRSDRHFVGTEEQKQRQREGSQVVNNVHLMDVGIQYNINARWSLELGIPFQFATRSSPIRDENRRVFDRSETHATGMGDVLVTAHRWMLDPATHLRGNIKFGFGIKLPTGSDSVTDIRTRYDENTGQLYQSVEHVDQSIQPGDGGLGILLNIESFYRFATNRAAYYGSASYLINPQGENGVVRGTSTTTTNSIPDGYVARTGLMWTPPSIPFSFSLGGRLEGLPWNDLFGSNAGFRRPGYIISVEPGINWGHGPHGITFAAPIALVRNRVKSASDRETGRHGDAAFADYSLLLTYFRRF